MKKSFNKKENLKFWKCINYPTCRGLINIEVKNEAANKKHKNCQITVTH